MIGLPTGVRKRSLLAAIFFVVVSQSSLIVTFRLVEFPTEIFTIYNVEGIPLWLAWMFVIMAALVAGICEETGFRGYMQGSLEERYGPVVSISFVSIIFLLSHLHQVWATSALLHLFMLSILLGILAYSAGSIVPSIIAHTCMDIFAFSYWWSDLLGEFEMQPISVTGIDFHFIFWSMILVISSGLFLWTSKKVMLARLDERSNMHENKQQKYHCEKISENWLII
jgi:membrane protease YdiL (CAAX protease family)